MDLFNSGDVKSLIKDKHLRKFISRPSLQYPNERPQGVLNGPYYPSPQWNHSSISLGSPPPNIGHNYNYHAPQAQMVPHHGLYHPVPHQHNWASTTNLPSLGTNTFYNNIAQDSHDSQNARDIVGDRFSEIIALIDEESYTGSGADTYIALPETPPPEYSAQRGLAGENERRLRPNIKPEKSGYQNQSRNINVLAKLSYYSNSRLPASLPPFRAYIPTYPLLCLAALCSANAYQYRQNASKNEQLISANARIGTKAMIVKSVTCSDEKTLVFAIRGTSVLSLRDWNVNLNYAPESPAGFLDDEGNYCHSGFLRVAKAMVKPIAARLQHLLEENPNRVSFSLLITGHSAGGAVASLLYAHMMSEHVKSELTILTDCFKRVHCVTFGAPPISLLPLKKPPSKEHKLRRSLFHSFINEGDPVVRAEKSYIMSLVDLLTTTPSSASSLVPSGISGSSLVTKPSGLYESSMSKLKITNLGLFTGSKKPKPRHHSFPAPSWPPRHNRTARDQIWAVPPATLSNAVRLVVLRGPEPPPKASVSQVDLTREFEEVRAYTVTDEEIRKVIFGDPLMHAMEVYRRRIEALAMKAVTGRDKFY